MRPRRILKKGLAVLYAAVMLVSFCGLAPLAVVAGHLMAVRNQLQRAANAAALAGASQLYIQNATGVNPGANHAAYCVAISSYAEACPIEVNRPDSNDAGVQRGHWSFATRTFTRSDAGSILPALYATDSNLEFINAVKVVTRRGAAAGRSFFEKIVSGMGFGLSAEAVACVGFAGTLLPGQATAPLAVCKQSITDSGGNYSCETGRFINSGTKNSGTKNLTGYWTDESNASGSGCSGIAGTDNNGVSSIIQISGESCNASNTNVIYMNNWLSTSSGPMQNAFSSFRQCWIDSAGSGQICNSSAVAGCPDRPWLLTVPVLDCANGSPTCNRVIGAADVDVLWITGDIPDYTEAPREIGNWKCPEQFTGQQCWKNFVAAFNLQNPDGTPAAYLPRSIYIIPDCSKHAPTGETGGGPFGVTAGIPELVR